MANQQILIDRLGTVTYIPTAQPDATSLNLVRGDAYDGISNNTLVWAMGKDVSSGTGLFTIRNLEDTVILNSGSTGVTVTTSGENLIVNLSSEATALLTDCVYKFDACVQLDTDSRLTGGNGLVNVTEDQSR